MFLNKYVIKRNIDYLHINFVLMLQAPPEPSYAAAERASKMRDYEVLSQIISQWNANRLDLFALTLPNEVRFHFRQMDIIVQ